MASKSEMDRIRDKARKGQRLSSWEAEQLVKSSKVAGSNDSSEAIRKHLQKAGK